MSPTVLLGMNADLSWSAIGALMWDRVHALMHIQNAHAPWNENAHRLMTSLPPAVQATKVQLHTLVVAFASQPES